MLIARIFGYVTIILFFACVILKFIQKSNATIRKDVLFIIYAVLISVVASIFAIKISNASELIDKLLSIVSFIIFYIALSIEEKEQEQFVLEDLFSVNYILCVVFILFAFGPFSFKYMVINEYGRTVFSMGLGNPNAVALYVMFSIVILFVQFNRLKKIQAKVLNVSLVSVLFYILYLLSSRAVFFSAILIAFAFLLKTPKFFKWLSYLIIFAPIVMLILQLYLAKMDSRTIQILSKAIDTGRPDIYTGVLRDIFGSPMSVVFGDLGKYHFYNCHNGLLTVFATIGLLGVIAYMLFWNRQLHSLRVLCVDRNQKIAFVAIIAIILHSSAESMGVVGTVPYSVFVVIIMKIAKGEIRSRHDRLTAEGI